MSNANTIDIGQGSKRSAQEYFLCCKSIGFSMRTYVVTSCCAVLLRHKEAQEYGYVRGYNSGSTKTVGLVDVDLNKTEVNSYGKSNASYISPDKPIIYRQE